MKQDEDRQLPEFLRPHFWDVRFENLDLDKKPRFILKRIINRGDTSALRWAKTKFSNDDIRELIMTTRDISRKTANFWAMILGVDPKRVPCLQKPYVRRKIPPLTAEYLNSLA